MPGSAAARPHFRWVIFRSVRTWVPLDSGLRSTISAHSQAAWFRAQSRGESGAGLRRKPRLGNQGGTGPGADLPEVRPRPASGWRHPVPGPPGRERAVGAAVTCERAGWHGSGRCGDRGELGHRRRAAPFPFKCAATRPWPGRQLPAGVSLLHCGSHPVDHDEQCREYGGKGHQEARERQGPGEGSGGAARIGEAVDLHGGEGDDQAAARPGSRPGQRPAPGRVGRAGPAGAGLAGCRRRGRPGPRRSARPAPGPLVYRVRPWSAVRARTRSSPPRLPARGRRGLPAARVTASRCRVLRSCHRRHLPLAGCR